MALAMPQMPQDPDDRKNFTPKSVKIDEAEEENGSRGVTAG
jgi:hypothetical protein